MLLDQGKYLNLTYSNSSIQYLVRGVDYTVSDNWAAGGYVSKALLPPPEKHPTKTNLLEADSSI